MPSQEATQQMIEEEVGPITATLDNLEYEMDSRTDSLQAYVDGSFPQGFLVGGTSTALTPQII